MTLKEKGDWLKEEADISRVVSALGIETIRKGDCYFLKCPNPFHQDVHATNCYFKEGWHNLVCLACGLSMKAIDLVMFTEGCTYKEAVRFLEQLHGGMEVEMALKEKKKVCLPKEIQIPIRQTLKKEYVQKEIPKGYAYTYSNENAFLLEKKEAVSWRDFFSDKEWQEFIQI